MKRAAFFLWAAAVGTACGQGGELTAADREALLKRLAEIRDAVDTRIDERYRVAISAYRTAMASDDAAISLYLTCVEKVDFTDQKRTGQDFRDWKRANDERLKDSGFRRALRHQLRWLVLSLQAASEDADRAVLAAQAQEIVDSIAGDVSNLSGHFGLLNQAVTGSVFARAYQIDRVEVEKWVLAPGQFGQIYEEILLPPLRARRQADALRARWQRRIDQEVAMFEAREGDGGRREGRIGMAANMRSPGYEKFVAEEVPAMRWQMEVDVFQHGDAKGAASRMLKHLEDYHTHGSLREWTQQFEDMLKVGTGTVESVRAPEVVPAPVVVPPPVVEEEPVFLE